MEASKSALQVSGAGIVSELVKRKKGRPKKNVVVESESVTTECKVASDPKQKIDNGGEECLDNVLLTQKKRGRKKKIITDEELTPKPKKKRGRKAAVKFFSSSIRKKMPLTAVISDKDNLILHIDVKEESDVCTMFENVSLEDPPGMGSEQQFIQTDSNWSEPLQLEGHLFQENTATEKQFTNRKKGYFEMMYDFMQNDEWLHNTDILCWWCCHKFTSVPLGLPLHYDRKCGKFRVKGVFCSFPCMLAYKNDKYKNQSNINELVHMLHRHITGESCSTDPAPSRYCLKVFGGDLSIEEFRGDGASKIYQMIEYPMYMSRDYVHEIDIENVKNVNNKVFKNNNNMSKLLALDSSRVAEAKSRLMEKEKTTVTIGNTIDKFIKIF
uniref:Uncharacterized protein n=1 Tax=viral metagenome TaxID=1070528 RepID=A0A6C0E0R1_9ZZZZ